LWKMGEVMRGRLLYNPCAASVANANPPSLPTPPHSLNPSHRSAPLAPLTAYERVAAPVERRAVGQVGAARHH
jgi:hypothetical protein